MIFLLLSLLFLSVFTADNALLTLARSHSCLKDVVFDFVKAENCTLLLDHQKSQLAIKMTRCLILHAGKQFPSGCQESFSGCKLQGDAWSTFTTFYAHIDNLCHFYWQMLHHERAEALISKLSQSSSEAQSIMRQNIQSSKKIMSIQEQMHANLKESITQQQQMAKLIESSATHISNITYQIETFVQNIREDIDQNYAGITKILSLINEGVSQIIQLQCFMKADITSINGVLFFLSQFLVILFITSFKTYQSSRNRVLCALFIQLCVQLTVPDFLYSLIGPKIIRAIFAAIMIGLLAKNSSDGSQWQNRVVSQLNTPRLQRLITKILHNQRQLRDERYLPGTFGDKIRSQIKENEGKIIVPQ